ncbi:MAG: RNA polymerase factor sigma-54 [Pseudomonadota bacterium]
MLNHYMMQAVKIMQMNRVELHEFLSETSERNPFLEIDRSTRIYENRANHGELPETTSDTKVSLYRHLASQFARIIHSNHEAKIALAFLQELAPSGWLTVPVECIAEANGFDLEMCQDILERLQTLEPAGVFARDLRECLRLQAIDQGLFDDVMKALIANLDQLAAGGLESLARRLKVDGRKLVEALNQLRRMNPKPGSAFDFGEIQPIDSDVVLKATDEGLTYELRKSSYPTVRISTGALIDEPVEGSHLGELKTLLAEAKAIQSAVEMRKTTTLAVVTAVFARQREFLLHGYAALSPMRMSDIADDIDVSEATVSRIVSGLSVQCPRGHITLKSLFCSSVSYGSQSQTKHVVLNVIKKLIAAEDKSSPLSDRKITMLLHNSGHQVSRRTVSKYRNALGLAPPATRRRQAKLSQLPGRAQHSNDSAGLPGNPEDVPLE